MSDPNERVWLPPGMDRHAFAEIGDRFSRASADFQTACTGATDARLRMAVELLKVVDYQVLRYLHDAVGLPLPDDPEAPP